MSRLRKPSPPVETEAKIRVESLSAVRRRLTAARARRLHSRTFETNTLYDSSGGALRSTGKAFRLRRYGKDAMVTLKGAATVSAGLKSRVELETSVGSFETFAGILQGVGLLPRFRYEKFREVWMLGRTTVCLDETPLGAFIEIEGTAPSIHRIARQLGVDRRRFLSDSYPALWAQAGRVGDMVFPVGKTA